MDGQPVPLFQVLLLIGYQFQLGCRVVDQGGQVVAVTLGHGISKQFHQFFLDFAGGRVENMQKGFVFAVDVRHEVFRAFGQVQYGLQPDDFGSRFLDGGVLICQKPQIVQLFRCKGTLVIQMHHPFPCMAPLYRIPVKPTRGKL